MDQPFGGVPWHHPWGGVPSLLSLLVLPMTLGVFALVLSFLGLVRARIDAYRKRRIQVSRPVPSLVSAQPILASDGEREQASASIAQAIGEGRLGLDEGGQRIEAIWQSRHRHEIRALVADLPPPIHQVRPRTSPAFVLALVVGIAAAVFQMTLGLWELWPAALAICLASSIASRRRFPSRRARAAR